MRRLGIATLLVLAQLGCAPLTQAACGPRSGQTTAPEKRLVLQNLTNGQGGREIMSAVFAGDVAQVRSLAGRDPKLLTTHVPSPKGQDFNPDGQFGDLLTVAVARCDRPMLDALLAMGGPPDGGSSGAALDHAIRIGDLDAARRLLEAGASPDPLTERHPDAMLTASGNRDLDAVKLLIAHGTKLDRLDSVGDTPLQGVVAGNSMLAAEVLIDAGADPWAVGAGGGLPAFNISKPLILYSDEEEAARQRLIARLRKPGVPWPPPNPAAVRAAIRADAWPPPELRAVGAKPAIPMVAEDAKRRTD